MKTQNILLGIFIIIVLFISIKSESFASGKSNSYPYIGSDIEETELRIEPWMLTSEHWKVGNKAPLIQESGIGEKVEYLFDDNAYLKLIIEVQPEDELRFEPWMFN